jgi:hypothetical protein
VDAATTSALCKQKALLLEFDDRFQPDADMIGSFIHFDYREDAPPAGCSAPEHSHQYDLVVADPPFLSADCWYSFIATSVALLRRDGGDLILASIPENESMLRVALSRAGRGDLAGRLKPAPFVPVQKGISHRFRFFTTFDTAAAARSTSPTMPIPTTTTTTTLAQRVVPPPPTIPPLGRLNVTDAEVIAAKEHAAVSPKVGANEPGGNKVAMLFDTILNAVVAALIEPTTAVGATDADQGTGVL